MYKKVLILISILLLLLSSAVVPASAAVDGVSFGLRLNKERYLPGETAEVEIYITDAATESASLINGLNANISFSGMTFTQGIFNAAIPAAQNGEILEIDANSISNQSIAYLFWIKDDTVSFGDLVGGTAVTDDTEIKIATLYFTVGTGDSVNASFADKTIPGTLPYETAVLDGNLNEYTYGFSVASDTSEVEDFGFAAVTPVATATGISAEAVLCAKENKVLIAKLQSKTENKLLAPISIQFIKPGRNELNIQFAYSGDAANAAVTYYVWNAVSGMIPLDGYTPVVVSAE